MVSYNQTIDNMVTTALETWSRDPINALTDSGEKFLKTAASQGRVFVVNDAENLRHPVMYDHGENSSLYTPDVLNGTPDGVDNLGTAAKEILTQVRFTLQAATRNINMPQSQPAGNLIDYVSNVVKANMMHILNEEEQLFTRGVAGAPGSTTSVRRDPAIGDTDYSAGFPMSLPALMLSSVTNSDSGDTTAELFAGVTTDELAKFEPYHFNTAQTNGDNLIPDLQKAVMNASYSSIERPTHAYTTLEVFETFLAKLRAFAALPDPVNHNIGKEGTIDFAGITLDWSRYLEAETMWDNVTPFESDCHPFLGINWNSLRLNTVRAGGIGSDSIGFIRQIGDMQPHPELTNVFKRIEWKRQWSVDNGRRSFFKISGITL